MQSKYFLSIWIYPYIPVEIRNFILLRSNNKILLNYQLSRFTSSGTHCSFCIFFPITYDTLETPEHLFFSCPVTKNLIDSYFSDFINDFHPNWKESFFKGIKSNDSKLRTYVNIEITLFTHYIYCARNMKKLPSLNGLKYHISLIKNEMISVSKKYKSIIEYLLMRNDGKFRELLRNLV